MPVIDVADAIRARLGMPTVEALAGRFGTEGTCPACGSRFGTARLSLCAFADDPEHVTLVAYHAGCRTTAWMDGGLAAEPGDARPPRAPTWRAALTPCLIRMPAPRAHGTGRRTLPRWRRVRRADAGEPKRRATREMQVPLLIVHPRLESSRVRVVNPAESVNADAEEYHRLGFADADELAAAPLTEAGAARLMTAGRSSAHVVVRAGFETWAAPVRSPSLVTLIRARGGVLVGVGCEADPQTLAGDPAALAAALTRGDLLLGWASLRPS